MKILFSPQEIDLLQAALNQHPEAAYVSWQRWLASTKIDQAPHSELRILPAVYANLSLLGFASTLPEKLKGKARATFTQNTILLNAVLPAIQALNNAGIPVLLCKGIDLCTRFNNWSQRSMGDVDFYIPPEMLTQTCIILENDNWIPQYGMTWDSLKWRSSLKRESWNLRRKHGDLDLHWSLTPGPSSELLFNQLWQSAQEMYLKGVTVYTPTPEFSLMLILQHAFVFGTKSDALQALIDIAKLQTQVNDVMLQPLLRTAGLDKLYIQVTKTITCIQTNTPPLAQNSKNLNNTLTIEDTLPIFTSQKPEISLVCYPKIYRAWQTLGYSPIIERYLLRLLGPMSKPLAPSSCTSLDWDVRECQILDTISGPGWSWPEPEHTCFWSDRPDARLLLPTLKKSHYLLVINLGEHWKGRPNYEVEVYANGYLLDCLPLDHHCQAVFWIPQSILIGNWVEISFRPKHFHKEMQTRPTRVCVPLRQVRLISSEDAADFFEKTASPNGLMQSVLNQEEPYYGQFLTIRSKILTSPERHSKDLPPHFDPLYYVLLNPDLFYAQVDPYAHYIHHGKSEGRAWK